MAEEIAIPVDAPLFARLRLGLAGRRGAAALSFVATISFCALLAAISISLQGFEFGVDNNAFHIPIVLHWYDLPQFASDEYIQSLRKYATPVYPFLGLFANDHNVEKIFFVSHLLTRTLTVYAFHQVTRACGLRGVLLLAAMPLLILSSAIYGFTAIGKDDLLLDFFTHTALAQAVALLGVAWLIRGNLVIASLAAGLAFDLNIMVGVWTLAPIALGCLIRLSAAPKSEFGNVLRAAIVFSIAALPVLIWVGMSQNFAPTDFDYRAYLIDFFPFHFFIGWANWSGRVTFLLQLTSGIAALRMLPSNRGAAAIAPFGFVLVFLAGAVIGQVSHSRTILNLHLLRVDGMVLWVVVSLVVTAIFAAIGTLRLSLIPGAMLAIVGLVAGNWRLVASGMLLLNVFDIASRRSSAANWNLPKVLSSRAVALVIVALVCVITAATYGKYPGPPSAPGTNEVPDEFQLAGARPRAPEWIQVTHWARTATARDAVFLVPPRLSFVSAAERRSWVGRREGAAAMWAPETYHNWKARSDEVGRLHSAAAQLDYACKNGINYVVLDKRPGHTLPQLTLDQSPIFDNRWFAVFAASNCKYYP